MRPLAGGEPRRRLLPDLRLEDVMLGQLESPAFWSITELHVCCLHVCAAKLIPPSACCSASWPSPQTSFNLSPSVPRGRTTTIRITRRFHREHRRDGPAIHHLGLS